MTSGDWNQDRDQAMGGPADDVSDRPGFGQGYGAGDWGRPWGYGGPVFEGRGYGGPGYGGGFGNRGGLDISGGYGERNWNRSYEGRGEGYGPQLARGYGGFGRYGGYGGYGMGPGYEGRGYSAPGFGVRGGWGYGGEWRGGWRGGPGWGPGGYWAGQQGAGAGTMGPPQRGMGPHVGRGPKGYRRSDQRIEEDVNEALTQNSHLDASNIEVKVDQGVVTLTGTVDTRRDKRLAEDIADSCPGVNDVDNQIRVEQRGNGQVGQTLQSEGQRQPATTGASSHS